MTSEADEKPKPLAIKTRAEREAALEEMLDAFRNKTSCGEPKEASTPAIGSIGSLSAEGIFLGQYTPKDRNGKSLSKTFNVFAAPQDLPETMNYVDAVKHIAKLKDWNGFDGTNYATDKEIYEALKDGSYTGGWIIPTRDLLCGKDVDGKATTPDNLYAHKDKGALKGTFKTAASNGSDYPDWYWSSTEHRDHSSSVHNVRFSDGYESWDHKGGGRLSCRPVRLVEVPSR